LLLRDYSITVVFISDYSREYSFKSLLINVQKAMQISKIQAVGQSEATETQQVWDQASEAEEAWARCPVQYLSASILQAAVQGRALRMLNL